MFGKHFASMYEGSLYGAGAVVFAVMGYVIATQRPDREHGSVVTLNSKKLADTLGESVEEIEKAISFLCRPDQESTTKVEEGRRLVKVAEFEYWVVNGAKYRAIRDEDERRRQNRESQRRLREAKRLITRCPAVPKGEEAGLTAKVGGEIAELEKAAESAVAITEEV